MLHKAWNSKGEMPYCFPRSSIKFQGHTGQNITDFDPNWAFPDYRPVAAFKSLRFALLYFDSNFTEVCSDGSSWKWQSAWTSYQIRKIAGCACAGNAGKRFPRQRLQRKSLVSDPGMHHSTCVTHVPWCMSGSLTNGVWENVHGIPGACATRHFT